LPLAAWTFEPVRFQILFCCNFSSISDGALTVLSTMTTLHDKQQVNSLIG
jgi:hypothetical protein